MKNKKNVQVMVQQQQQTQTQQHVRWEGEPTPPTVERENAVRFKEDLCTWDPWERRSSGGSASALSLGGIKAAGGAASPDFRQKEVEEKERERKLREAMQWTEARDRMWQDVSVRAAQQAAREAQLEAEAKAKKKKIVASQNSQLFDPSNFWFSITEKIDQSINNVVELADTTVKSSVSILSAAAENFANTSTEIVGIFANPSSGFSNSSSNYNNNNNTTTYNGGKGFSSSYAPLRDGGLNANAGRDDEERARRGARKVSFAPSQNNNADADDFLLATSRRRSGDFISAARVQTSNATYDYENDEEIDNSNDLVVNNNAVPPKMVFYDAPAPPATPENKYVIPYNTKMTYLQPVNISNSNSNSSSDDDNSSKKSSPKWKKISSRFICAEHKVANMIRLHKKK